MQDAMYLFVQIVENVNAGNKIDIESIDFQDLLNEQIYITLYHHMFPFLQLQIKEIEMQTGLSSGEKIQMLVQLLASDVLQLDLSHIKGSEIVKGDLKHLLNLLELLFEISIIFKDKQEETLSQSLNSNANQNQSQGSNDNNLERQKQQQSPAANQYQQNQNESSSEQKQANVVPSNQNQNQTDNENIQPQIEKENQKLNVNPLPLQTEEQALQESDLQNIPPEIEQQLEEQINFTEEEIGEIETAADEYMRQNPNISRDDVIQQFVQEAVLFKKQMLWQQIQQTNYAEGGVNTNEQFQAQNSQQNLNPLQVEEQQKQELSNSKEQANNANNNNAAQIQENDEYQEILESIDQDGNVQKEEKFEQIESFTNENGEQVQQQQLQQQQLNEIVEQQEGEEQQQINDQYIQHQLPHEPAQLFQPGQENQMQIGNLQEEQQQLRQILQENIDKIRDSLEKIKNIQIPKNEPHARLKLLKQRNEYKRLLNEYLKYHRQLQNQYPQGDVDASNFIAKINQIQLRDFKFQKQYQLQERSNYYKLRDEKVDYLQKIHKIIFELEKRKIYDNKKKYGMKQQQKTQETKIILDQIEKSFNNKISMVKARLRNQNYEKEVAVSAQKNVLQRLEQALKNEKYGQLQQLQNNWSQEKQQFDFLVKDDCALEQQIMELYQQNK